MMVKKCLSITWIINERMCHYGFQYLYVVKIAKGNNIGFETGFSLVSFHFIRTFTEMKTMIGTYNYIFRYYSYTNKE